MSRIGKLPVIVPEGVSVDRNGQQLTFTGKEGSLSYNFSSAVTIELNDGTINFSIDNEEKKPIRGTSRALCANMVEGVINGFEKKLLVIGVGFGAQLQGETLILNLGFSHKIEYIVPDGVQIFVEKNPAGEVLLRIRSLDKQKVGQVAAEIRSFRKPDPYKGKGVRYVSEQIKLKPTKSIKK